MVSARDVVAASIVVFILRWQLSQELEASAPTSESSSFRRLCSFILIIWLSSHQYSAAKRIYKPINPGGRALWQPNIVLHVPGRAGSEEPRVPRGTFIISPFAVKCAMSVEHSLVIFLLYSTMHWPFCKIMVLSPYQLICCQSVTYLNKISASVNSTGPGEALAVLTNGRLSGPCCSRQDSGYPLFMRGKWVLSRGCYFLEGETSGTVSVYHLFPGKMHLWIRGKIWMLCSFGSLACMHI